MTPEHPGTLTGVSLTKAHAYGNDFLYVPCDDWTGRDWEAVARALCDRHAGAGADGLVLYDWAPGGARMRLYNADGSPSEVSGNGLRGLAALVILRHQREGRRPPAVVTIETDAGPKTLELIAASGARMTFRAAMGHPDGPERRRLDVGGAAVDVVVLRVGNPQCVLLDAALDEERYRRLGPILERHPAFPAGTNVEFACVERRDLVRILIWERGVGPTLASGTGACAAAVAAAAFGGADRCVDVASPGGVQRVEWLDAGLFLTGWAEVVWEGRWIR